MKSDFLKPRLARWTSVLALAALAACGGGGGDSGTPAATNTSGATGATSSTSVFSAVLTGAQETPPNASIATGNATATFDSIAKTLIVNVTTSGIAGTVAHIHEAPPGVPGAIIFPLTQSPPGSGNWTTMVTLTDAQVNTLMAGNYFVNVHSAAFPAGEIRGQLTTQQQPSASNVGGGGGGGGGY